MKMYGFRSTDGQKIASILISLVGIFSQCSAFDTNQGVDIKVDCNHTGMLSNIYLDAPFGGIVFAHGSFYNPSCRYEMELVPPLTRIPLYLPANDCGTVIREVDGSTYMSNFIVIQKYRFLETAGDIIKNISCKIPPSKASNLVDLEENRKRAYYHSANLTAWMEFRWGSDVYSSEEVNKLKVGEEVLMIVHLKDSGQNKDIRIHKCWAFDGKILSKSKYIVELYDYYTCEESIWMSNFILTTGMPNVSDTLTYATLKAFKFPSTRTLYFTCAIEICSNNCLPKCNEDRPQRNNSEARRKIHKRAISPTGWEPIPTGVPLVESHSEMTTVSPAQQAYLDRINFMKATIKAMGSKLIQAKESKSENDSSFRKRVLGSTIPPRSGRVEKNSTVQVKLLENDISSLSENVTEISLEPSNTVYIFNLSHSVIVTSTHELLFSRETFGFSQMLKNCVSRLRFILITVILAFIIFCLVLVCLALAISLHREKKKHKIDNFLLYNYF